MAGRGGRLYSQAHIKQCGDAKALKGARASASAGAMARAAAKSPTGSPTAPGGSAPALWDAFVARFDELLAACLPRHAAVARALSETVASPSGTPNVLLYGARGFPLELVYRAAVRARFGAFHLRDHAHGAAAAAIPYRRCGYFLELDFAHPNLPKELEPLTEFVRDVVSARFAHAPRHIVVLRNVDALRDRQAFRVLLERFSANALFVCTTHRIGALEAPLRSRFEHMRVPLPTADETRAVLAALGAAPAARAAAARAAGDDAARAGDAPPFLKALWLASAGVGFGAPAARYHYAPIAEFLARAKPAPTLEDARAAAVQAYQANVPLARVAEDIARWLDAERRAPRRALRDFVEAAAELERAHATTHKGRAPLYYERLVLLGLQAADR